MSQDLYAKSKFVKELTPKDFESLQSWKLKNKDCGIIAFYADWCPHCQQMTDLWNGLGEKAAFFNVYAFNCANANNENHASKIKKDKPGLIQGYPSIIVYKNGNPVETFQGPRDVASLLNICIRNCKK